MTTDKLFKSLSGIVPLPKGFREALERELIPLSFPKNHYLVEAPKVVEHAYFLEKGFAMTYAFVEGKKVIDAFWSSGQVIVSASSFFDQTPAKEFIQLLEDSELYGISYDSVMSILERYPEAHFIYRATINQYYEDFRARVHDMQRLTAEARLSKLLTSIPELEQLVPQDTIASYLGITPQSLSRIKRNRPRT